MACVLKVKAKFLFQGIEHCSLPKVCLWPMQEVATIAGMFLADKVGRRHMLIQTTVQSLIAQAVLAGILAKYTDANTIEMGALPSKAAIILVSPLLPRQSKIS